MLKTNKLVSLILAVVLVVSMFTVALTSTSALSDGETWVVAGSGGLCGGEWQMPPSDSNYMSYNPENGNYEIVYNGIAAGTYEFKVVNGTTWGDPDYNLEGQANGGANGTVTVTEANSTVLIGCDGSKAYVQVTAGGDTPVVPDPQPTDAPITGETMTVYFQNNWMWTDVCAYWWVGGAEWPGEAAELVGNDGTYDIYAVTVPTTAEGIIFNGQDAGIGAENKTPDIKDAADGDCYYMVWNDTEQANAVGKESIDVILPDEPATDEPATDEPATDEPATDEPATDEPTPAGLFVKADGVLYTVKQGEVYTYEIKIAPDAPVCSWDASVWYDEEGLEPQYPVDKRGNVDKAALCPVFGDSAEVNTDIPGEFLFNYSSSSGKWFEEDDTTALTLGFKVTAAEGIYEINAQIRDLAVLDENDKLVSYIEGSEDKVEAEKINKELLFDADPYNPDVTEEPGTDEPGTDEPATDEPATDEPATDEPATDEPATDEPATDEPTPAGLFVKADGVLYTVKQGEVYTYEIKIAPDAPVCSWDASVWYDEEGLEPQYPVDKRGNVDKAALCPVFGDSAEVNTDIPGEFLFNYSSSSGKWFEEDDTTALTLGFKVTAAEGIYEINAQIRDLAVLDENDKLVSYIEGSEDKVEAEKINKELLFDADPYNPDVTEEPGTDEPGTDEPGTDEPGTDEPGTDEPGTEEPGTEEPPVPETFYVAAGDAPFFGTQWDPANRDNELLPNEDGTYSKTYTDVPAGTYQFKVTTNGAWDIGDYNLEGDAKYGGANAVAEVLYDNATVTIGFDGTKATLDIKYATEPGTEDPGTEEPGTEEPGTEEPGTEEPGTEEPGTEEPSKKLQIRVDNDKVYDVQTGEVYTYTFYLGCDATVASLAATTFYSADGIEFIPALNDKGKDSKAEFVNLSPIIWNHATAGEIKYTYSNVDGYDFPVAAEMTDDNIVFRGSFKVTATEGIYDIYTDLITLGDTDNNKIIFNSEVVNPDVVVNRADTLDGNFAPPVEPGTEEPGTEEPGTEEPGTEEPGTDEPGTDEPGTDEPTEVPGPATGDQSSSDDDGNGAGPGVQTGSTVYAIAFLAVLLMAAGLVMFSRKRSNG